MAVDLYSPNTLSFLRVASKEMILIFVYELDKTLAPSIKLYQKLLSLYPPSYEFREAVEVTFEEQCKEAHAVGWLPLLKVWLLGVMDWLLGFGCEWAKVGWSKIKRLGKNFVNILTTPGAIIISFFMLTGLLMWAALFYLFPYLTSSLVTYYTTPMPPFSFTDIIIPIGSYILMHYLFDKFSGKMVKFLTNRKKKENTHDRL